MKHTFPAIILSLAAFVAAAQTATPPTPTVRLRGTVQTVNADNLTLKERSGETITLALSDKLVVQEVFPIQLADIKAGSYIGTAALPQADGTQRALMVLVFPEAARGTGEGHRPYDLQADSTMTNATVADLVAAPEGRKLQLKYKDGEKTVLVPQGVPVVSFRPGDRGLLVPGASVVVTAQEVGGKPIASRINAGRSGFAIPL